MDEDLIERLSAHRTLGSAPRAELEWLAAHGKLRTVSPDDNLSFKGRPVEALYIILSGHAVLLVDRGKGPEKIAEWRGGDVSGLLPYSRLAVAPGDSRILETVEVLVIPRSQFQAMTRECFEVTSILVHTMVDRARLFTSSDLENEKMLSLGKLSAGLAHELNNPASAIQRCIAMLERHLKESESSAGVLVAGTLSQSQLAALEAIRATSWDSSSPGNGRPPRTPLELADREEAVADWLARHGADTVNADALAETEITLDSLDRLAASVPPAALAALLGWLAASCAVRNLADKIHSSAAQISRLIEAVKGFTHMDQANVAEPVDVRSGLADTVAVLQAKAREKSVTVTLELEAGLPRVRAFAAELNQVWSSLIDNALDAVARGGRVQVLADLEGPKVRVRIVDDGPGIPAEISSRIFDPFFTTKPMGQGIGLGLDIARRLALHNNAAIDFTSSPGRTEFRVTFPVST